MSHFRSVGLDNIFLCQVLTGGENCSLGQLFISVWQICRMGWMMLCEHAFIILYFCYTGTKIVSKWSYLLLSKDIIEHGSQKTRVM